MSERNKGKEQYTMVNATENRQGRIMVFSAPSGAGKTTLLDYLREQIPELVYSISATTRAPREHEKSGIHYFFLSEQEFKEKIEANEFAEWEIVHGNYYGTPRSFIDSNICRGKHVVMDIDVWGKTKFDAVYPQAVGILILPPSMDELEKRLRARNTDSEGVIRTRLENAKKEIAYAQTRGKYEYTLINDDLRRVEAELLSIVNHLIGHK
ncbi:MAG: guanylate kinase [Chitinivibrionales bacterium]